MANVDNLQEQLFTLQGDGGEAHVCRMLGLFDFEELRYALLLNLGEPGKEGEEDPSTVVMRFSTRGEGADEQAVFSIIENDDEYDRVIDFIQKLAEEMDEDFGEEPNEDDDAALSQNARKYDVEA